MDFISWPPKSAWSPSEHSGLFPPPGAGKREEPEPRRKFASSGGPRGRSGRRSLFKANSELRNLRAAFKAPSHTGAQQSALLLFQPLASPRREKEHTLGAGGVALFLEAGKGSSQDVGKESLLRGRIGGVRLDRGSCPRLELQSRESMTIFDGVLKSMLLDSACKVSTTIQSKTKQTRNHDKTEPRSMPLKGDKA